MFIPICQAEISELEKEYVAKAVEDGMLSGRAPTVRKFEEKFAEYIGVRHSCLVPNGTIALHLALRVLDIGPGDEIILPSQTISSCIFAVHYLGATAVIVDVDKDTWCVSGVRHVVTNKTKAIMPVHLYGLMCPMGNFTGYGTSVVSDCAEAIGSEWDGHKAGSMCDLGCFSLFFNKLITGGEAGIITTNSDELIENLRYFRDLGFGKTPETKFVANDLAFNYRCSGVVAALCLAQLERIDYLLGRRLEIHSWYKKYLSPEFVWQKVPEGYKNSYWMEAVLIPQKNGHSQKNELMQYMRENEIETRPCFPPLGSHPYLKSGKYPYKNVDSERNSQYIWDNGVLLPSGGAGLTEDVVRNICRIANEFIGE